jgi:serine protease Do
VGSGFIVDPAGFILTNHHVLDGADEIIVTLTDKREFKAKVIGSDKRTDVALVKIEASGLPSLRIGDPGRSKVGEWVLAIGSPFGLENTVTAGIISAKARDTGDFLPFIQTDVAVNPGNSGGPLLNMRGEVIGINSQIYSRTGGFMGISFAIPIDEAMRVADQLRSKGRVVRGRIGVSIGEVGKEVAEALGMGKAQGALVRMVETNGPADKAGVEAGDVILRFDGKSIEKSSDLPRIVGSTQPGNKSTITVLRRGSNKDLNVVVAEIEPEKLPVRKAQSGAAPTTNNLGLSVSDLPESRRKDTNGRGILVDVSDGPATNADIRKGDIILSIGNTELMSAKAFNELVTKLPAGKPVALLVWREGTATYKTLKPSAKSN